MLFQNKYGIYGFKEKDFAYNWLGAKVWFKLLGKGVQGEVTNTDGCYHTLSVEFIDGKKKITAKGHFNCFKKIL